MTVLDLVQRLGGSVLSNKARVTVNGTSVVVGRLLGTSWEWTPEGQSLAALHSRVPPAPPEPAPEPPPAPPTPTRSRKSR